VSHELRSPLTALHGEIEVALRNQRSPEEYRRVLRSSLEEIDRMIELTEELLLVTRAEARLVEAQRAPTDVNALVRAALDRQRARLDAKELVVEASLAAPDAGVDAGLFAALVARLIDNAVKFAPPGGRVRVATERYDGGLRLAVEDSGDGIAEEDLPHVFDPFFRADQARTSGSGTGLGLTLAVGEDDEVDGHLADELLQLGLGDDRDAGGIRRAGELGRVAPTGDARDLGGGEGHDLDGRVVTVDDVEVMEVATRRAHDHDACPMHGGSLLWGSPDAPRAGRGLPRPCVARAIRARAVRHEAPGRTSGRRRIGPIGL
jgi:hypothetical protein